jgi:hypothetical protein
MTHLEPAEVLSVLKAAKRQARADAKKQFGQAILNGEFPSSEILSVLSDSFNHIPENIQEAFEELLCGTCTLREMDYYDAVQLIRQRGRIGERARQRTARVGLPGDDPTRPLAEPEAFALLGVAQGCTPEELAHAYHLTMSQWHPDKLDSMAPEHTGVCDTAHRTDQRGISIAQGHDGAEPCERRIASQINAVGDRSVVMEPLRLPHRSCRPSPSRCEMSESPRGIAAPTNWVAVGIPVTRHPPHRSVRALISAYGSYLG